MRLKEIFDKQYRKIEPVVEKVQRVLVFVFLVMIYIFIFGITLLAVLIFQRNLLRLRGTNKDSAWEKAQGCEADQKTSLRQV